MMKRFISSLLVAALVVSTGTSVFASPNNKAKLISKQDTYQGVKIPYGIAKKFNDLEKFPWAEQAVEKMRLKGLVKGVDDGKYAPKSAVTKLETIIMALRVMGWEDEIKDLKDLPKNYKGKEVDDWAKGYVTLAYEKGLLDDVDMMYFNPQAPALRHEVAKYVIRALGYEDEAQDKMDVDLNFDDQGAIPQGSIGYVYLVNEMKLMVGDDGKFNPMGTLTRAEMAVLFNRLDEKVDSNVDQDELKGQITRISDLRLTLKIDGELETFVVDSDVAVYKNDRKISYSSLSVQDYVLVQVEDDAVVYIEVINQDDADKIISQFKGNVTDISSGSINKLSVQVDKMEVTFEVLDDVKVIFNNKEGSFGDINVNDAVTVTVDSRNRAREIKVYRDLVDPEITIISGKLAEVGVSAIKLIVNGVNKVYYYDDIYTISIEGTSAKFSDLKEGMNAKITLEDGKVVKVEATKESITVDSKIVAITKLSSGEYKLTLIIDNEEKIYLVDDEADIYIPGVISEKVEDLQVDQQGAFTIENDIIIKIVIE